MLIVMLKGNGNSSRTEENLRRIKSVSSEASDEMSSRGDGERNVTSRYANGVSSHHDQSVKRMSRKMVEEYPDVI